jgi:hypothetical protein
MTCPAFHDKYELKNQVSVHLAKKFLEENILKISANQKQESPVVTMFVSGSGRNA